MTGPKIIRAHRSEERWEALPVALLRDDRLSYRARGIAARLLTNKDGFAMPMAALANLRKAAPSMPGACREGRQALLNALAELRSFGYVVQTRRQTPKGHWVTETVIFDSPQMAATPCPTAQPTPPKSGNRTSVKQSGEPRSGKPSPATPEVGEPEADRVGPKSSKSTTSKSTSQETTTTAESNGFALIPPISILEGHKSVVVGIVSKSALDPVTQQAVLDELEWRARSPQGVERPAAFVLALVKKAVDGDFIVDGAVHVSEERARKAKAKVDAEAALERRAKEAAAAADPALKATEEAKQERLLLMMQEAAKRLGFPIPSGPKKEQLDSPQQTG